MLSQDEIDSLLSSISVGVAQAATEERPSGSSGGKEGGSKDPEQRNCKLYNFRRPDKFSKDHLRALQTMHEGFARQLGMTMTAYLRIPVEVDVVSVDQLTYDEFVRSMPSPITVSIMELFPLPGQVLYGMGYEVTSTIIDRMLGGTGHSDKQARELTDIESALLRRVIERSMVSLEESWRSIMKIQTKFISLEESYSLIQVATPGEIVALVTFEIAVGTEDTGLMSLCIPYPVLQGVMGQLSAQHIFHGQQNEIAENQQDKILDKLNHAKIPIQVLMGGTKISVKELLDLSVGDVIQLDRGVAEDLLLNVNSVPKFFCRPGTLKKNLAVYIADVVENPEALEGFGLSEIKMPKM